MTRGRKSVYDDRKHELARTRFNRWYERHKLSLKHKRQLQREREEKEFKEFVALSHR